MSLLFQEIGGNHLTHNKNGKLKMGCSLLIVLGCSETFVRRIYRSANTTFHFSFLWTEYVDISVSDSFLCIKPKHLSTISPVWRRRPLERDSEVSESVFANVSSQTESPVQKTVWGPVTLRRTVVCTIKLFPHSSSTLLWSWHFVQMFVQ